MCLTKLPNIGPKLAKLLQTINIYSLQDLKNTGSIKAVKLLEISREQCYNKLYALEGAIQGVRWHDLSNEFLQELKSKFDKTV